MNNWFYKDYIINSLFVYHSFHDFYFKKWRKRK